MAYEKSFKEKALALSDEIGVKKAAEQLGLKYCTLSNWRCERNLACDPPLSERERDELLEKRLIQLEEELKNLKRLNSKFFKIIK